MEMFPKWVRVFLPPCRSLVVRASSTGPKIFQVSHRLAGVQSFLIRKAARARVPSHLLDPRLLHLLGLPHRSRVLVEPRGSENGVLCDLSSTTPLNVECLPGR